MTIYPAEDGTSESWLCGLCGKSATAIRINRTDARLATAPSAREIFETFFGVQTQAPGPYVEGDRIGVRWSDETSLRKGLASIALAYGWTVEEEVVVPGWGRIDIVLRNPGAGDVSLIELKLDLTKPAKIRRAFQQADGYGRWWASNRGSAANTYLVGAADAAALVGAAADLYPAVRYLNLSTFIGFLDFCGNRETRARVATRRRSELQAQIAIFDAAIAALETELPP